MMKRKLKSKRKNPSVASDLISTQIKSIGNKYKVTTFIGTQKILELKEKFPDYSTANKAAEIAKKVLVKNLENTRRRNPEQLENSFKQAIGSSIGLPEDKMSAFELGRLYGIQMSLEKYCGALNYFSRRSILKTINREISNALGNLARKIAVRGEGIEGPLPFVKKSGPKN